MAQLKSASSITSCFVKLLVTGSFLLFPLTLANAQEPQLVLNWLEVSVPDVDPRFDERFDIGTDGVIEPIIDVPRSARLRMPTFSFQPEPRNIPPSSSYEFRAGMIIYDNDPDSMRRLELDIPRVNIRFDSNGMLDGEIPPQNFNVWGRSENGEAVAVSLPTSDAENQDEGGLRFDGNEFQFDADKFIRRIAPQGGRILGDIINTIDAGNTFNYSLVLKQVEDPANSEEPDIVFGSDSDPGASFEPFPTVTVADDAAEAEDFAVMKRLIITGITSMSFMRAATG